MSGSAACHSGWLSYWLNNFSLIRIIVIMTMVNAIVVRNILRILQRSSFLPCWSGSVEYKSSFGSILEDSRGSSFKSLDIQCSPKSVLTLCSGSKGSAAALDAQRMACTGHRYGGAAEPVVREILKRPFSTNYDNATIPKYHT